MSLIKMIKRIGHSIDPWGTPSKVKLDLDIFLLPILGFFFLKVIWTEYWNFTEKVIYGLYSQHFTTKHVYYRYMRVCVRFVLFSTHPTCATNSKVHIQGICMRTVLQNNWIPLYNWWNIITIDGAQINMRQIFIIEEHRTILHKWFVNF